MSAFSKMASSGVRILPRSNVAGPIVLSPIDDHRIVMHASRTTWSVCTETGTRHLRRSGDIDLVPAGQTGGFAAEASCRSLEIRLPPAVLQLAANEMGYEGGRVHLEARHLMRNDRIVHLARALEDGRRSAAPADPLYTEAVGLALATQLIGRARIDITRLPGLSDRQLRRLIDFVETHIDKTLTIATLAREAGASSSHLRHGFKQAMGITLHRYVMQRRVERALLLLIKGDVSAIEAALSAGFSHQSHMARWMRRELGYTLRDLRAKEASARQKIIAPKR